MQAVFGLCLEMALVTLFVVQARILPIKGGQRQPDA